MKILQGQVIAVKSQLTATVRVDRLWRHPLYHKSLKRSRKYLCHNQINAQLGDQVQLLSSRPISKRKHYLIEKIIKRNSDSARKSPRSAQKSTSKSNSQNQPLQSKTSKKELSKKV